VPLALSALAQIPVLGISLSLYYRTVYIPGPGGVEDPFRTRPHEGRWPTGWTLSTASSPVTAWAEYCRNNPDDITAADVTGGIGLDPASFPSLAPLRIGPPLPPRSMYRLSFEFERLADLLNPWAAECLERSGFSLDDFQADPPSYGACPELASLAEGLGWEAMRVPSAALRSPDAFCVPVFSAGRSRLRDSERIVERASPTVATAYVTAYADDLRPSWLRMPAI